MQQWIQRKREQSSKDYHLGAKQTLYKTGRTGFSLLELLMVLTVLGILASLGTPSLVQGLHLMHLRADSRQLHSYLTAARHQAVSHSVTVLLCPQSSMVARTCAHGLSSWDSGWLLFRDLNADNELQADELQRVMPKLKHTRVYFNQVGRLRFFADGSARSAGFYLCSSRIEDVRHFALLYSGRVRVSDSLTNKQRKQCLGK